MSTSAVENVEISVRLLVNLPQLGSLGVLQLVVAHHGRILLISLAGGLDFDREREVDDMKGVCVRPDMILRVVPSCNSNTLAIVSSDAPEISFKIEIIDLM